MTKEFFSRSLLMVFTAAIFYGGGTGTGAMAAGTNAKNKKTELEKTPKSLFLIKKVKISPEVGEPQFDPVQAQLRTVINDPALENVKKYE